MPVSSSLVFICFWGSILISCAGLWFFASCKREIASKVDGPLFWMFGMVMIMFAMFRPLGIAPDDQAYLEIYNRLVCPTLTCRHWVQGVRDWGWYSLVGILKSIGEGPRVMLLISALGLLAKLWVIFKLSPRPMLALLFFTGVFYEVQDLTAFRVSLSQAVFMLAILLLIKQRRILGSLTILTPGLFHKQAFLTPLILMAGILSRSYAFFVLLSILPICLLFLGLSYRNYQEILPYLHLPWVQLLIKHGIDSYIALSRSGAYDNVRIMPYSYLPLVGLIICFSREVFLKNKDLYRYCAFSFVIACWLTWLFAAWQEPQARFFEYFALPTVLLVGNFRNSLLSNLGVVVVSAIFVVRYNVLHPLLTG